MHLERCLRCVPHDEDTGGFFVATLRKIATKPTSSSSFSSSSSSSAGKLLRNHHHYHSTITSPLPTSPHPTPSLPLHRHHHYPTIVIIIPQQSKHTPNQILIPPTTSPLTTMVSLSSMTTMVKAVMKKENKRENMDKKRVQDKVHLDTIFKKER